MKVSILSLAALVLLGNPTLAETWKFGIMGDNRGDLKHSGSDDGIAYNDGGVNTTVLADLGNALRDENVEFVIHLGDLAAKYKSKYLPHAGATTGAALVAGELDLWIDTWNEASDNLPVYPVRGNHEATIRIDKDDDGNMIFAEPPEALTTVRRTRFPDLPQNGPPGAEGLSFSFEHENVLFVGLDQYAATADPDVPTVDQSWLTAQLANSTAPHKIVFGHAPAFPSTDPKLPDIHKALPSPGGVLDEDAQAVRDEFWNILGDAEGANVYFTAHEHLYARAAAEDDFGNIVRQVIVGAGGAPRDPDPQLLYVENDEQNPRVVSEVDFRDFLIEGDANWKDGFGYLLCEVDGPEIIAQYWGESSAGAGDWRSLDTFTIHAAPAVPEPSSIAMLTTLLATVGVTVLLRKRKGSR